MSVDEFPIGSIVHRTSIVGDIYGIVIGHQHKHVIIKVLKCPPSIRGTQTLLYSVFDVYKV
jgi:hypothetical protein